MASYLLQVAYTAEAVKAMVKSPHSREEIARKAIESLGGKLHSFHFAFGEYDAVLILEAPSNVAAGALAMATAAGGAFTKFRTTPLMTAAESIEAMKLAKTVAYTPPK